jgi:hypothetical protein
MRFRMPALVLVAITSVAASHAEPRGERPCTPKCAEKAQPHATRKPTSEPRDQARLDRTARRGTRRPLAVKRVRKPLVRDQLDADERRDR